MPVSALRRLAGRVARAGIRARRAGGDRSPDEPGRMPTVPVEGRPTDARAANLDLVSDALALAGVEHFLVRRHQPLRTVVGIRTDRWTPAMAAVAARWGSDRTVRCTVAGAGARSPIRVLGDVATSDLERASVVRLWRTQLHRPTGLRYGNSYACELERWIPSTTRPGHLVSPRPNAIASSVGPADLTPQEVDLLGRRRPTIRAFGRIAVDEIDFAIDAVYTWVDGEDPAWQQRRAEHAGAGSGHEVTAAHRFRSRDELRHSLRSLDMYAPWVRHVYLVTAGQVPDFLDPDAEGLTVIDHEQIAPDPDVLPTFNSSAIIAWLHRIPDLSEHFLFLNDDFFFGRDVAPSLFFHPNGLAKVFPAPTVRPLDDEPITQPEAAARNVRELLERDFERTPARVVRHVPCPLLRSVLAEQAERYRDTYARTMAARFRSHDSVAADQLFHSYAQLTGRATAATLRYGYVALGGRRATRDLAALRRRDRDAFCLNDTPPGPDGGGVSDEELARFLGWYFPIPSRWERDGCPPSPSCVWHGNT